MGLTGITNRGEPRLSGAALLSSEGAETPSHSSGCNGLAVGGRTRRKAFLIYANRLPMTLSYAGNRRLLVWLVESYQESLRPIDFQSIDSPMVPHHAWLQSEPHNLVTCFHIKRRQGGASRCFQFLVQRRDIAHHKVHLYPSGGTRRAEILADDDQEVAKAIGPNAVRLRMVQPLHEGGTEHGFEQLFVQMNVGRFNLDILECTADRQSTVLTGDVPHRGMGFARRRLLRRYQRDWR